MMELVIAVVLGAGAGVLAGVFGVGGGIVFVPILVLFFGLDQVEAEATSLLAIVPTAVVGTWRQHRYGNVRWRSAAIIGATAVVGVEAGVLIATSIPEHILRRLFGLLVIGVAAHLAWQARRVS